MTDPEDIQDPVTGAFDEYVIAFRSGQGDPAPFLSRFEGRERQELALLIEVFIETAPASNPETGDPRFEKVFERVLAEVDGASGGLSEMVRGLRAKLGLGQVEVVKELSSALDATPAEVNKIDGYYHDLEWGTLPSSGISKKVYDALASILQTKPGTLKEAGAALGPGRPSSAGMAFARTVDETEFELDGQESPAMDVPSGNFRASDPPDRIDDLFTGG